MSTATIEKPSKKIVDFANDPHIDRRVKQFLKMLNGGGGPPLETLTPLEARKVLVDAQASVKVDLSGIEVSEKTITSDGYTVQLHVVRPEGVKENFLYLFLFMEVVGYSAIFQRTSVW
jgi:hypothetical protein